tara:strand:+ start:2047 stop:2517 length:471 start_codon:yes stop_codon:yes gene_type:complete
MKVHSPAWWVNLGSPVSTISRNWIDILSKDELERIDYYVNLLNFNDVMKDLNRNIKYNIECDSYWSYRIIKKIESGEIKKNYNLYQYNQPSLNRKVVTSDIPYSNTIVSSGIISNNYYTKIIFDNNSNFKMGVSFFDTTIDYNKKRLLEILKICNE